MRLKAHTPQRDPPIVFFDGVCGLCNRFVDWLLVHDERHVFRFAPLQGPTARNLLGHASTEEPTSVVLYMDGVRTYKTAAVAAILRELGGLWPFLGRGLSILPTALADAGYDLMASQRYRLFGKREACRLPTAAERALFLD